jgi:hypothetical protein
MKLLVCTLGNRVIKYCLRSLETDETNPLGDVLRQQKKDGEGNNWMRGIEYEFEREKE